MNKIGEIPCSKGGILLFSKCGNATLLAFFVLMTLVSFGALYLKNSRSAMAIIDRETEQIIARNLAVIALESAKLIIKDHYSQGENSINYDKNYDDFRFGQKEEEGNWKVKKIVPLRNTDLESDISSFYEYHDLDYVDAYERLVGKYDIYRVETEGTARKSGLKVNLESLIKIIRWNNI